jgi:F0F1-type ATP synthase gamma subunit
MKKDWDAVDIIYTHFKTTLKQETKHRQVLPASGNVFEELITEIIPEYGRYSELKKIQQAQQTRYNYSYTNSSRIQIKY